MYDGNFAKRFNRFQLELVFMGKNYHLRRASHTIADIGQPHE